MRTLPPWLLAILWAGVLLALVWVVVFPLLPVSSLLARDAGASSLELIRSHRTTVPFHLAWSSEGWRWVGWPGRLLPALLVAISIAVGMRRSRHPTAQETASQRNLSGLGVVVVSAVVASFWFGRIPIPVLITYGDSLALIPQIAQGTWVFPAEPLMMHLFNLVSRMVTAWRGVPDGVLSGQLTAAACGAVFIVSLWTLAKSRRHDTVGTLLLVAAFAGTGTMTQFFGVIETTLLQTAAVAAFLTTSALVLQAPAGSTRRDLLLLLTHLCMGVLLSAHAAGVALLPSLGVLWVALWFREDHHGDAPRHRLLSLRNVAGALLGALLPWLVFVWWPFGRLGNFGNSAGGADAYRFVPWDIEAARQTSSYVYYAMLSRLHAVDVLAAAVAACPFALLLLFAALVLRRRAAGQRRAVHAVFGTAAAGCTAVVLLWDFDFGMWGDWNIVTCYLLPLHLASWLAFDDALQQNTVAVSTRRWLLDVPLVVAQIALGLGLWLQFHPPGVR
jgi:hypothetical protein